MKERLLCALRKLEFINSAAQAAGIAVSTHKRWMTEDPTYRQNVESLLEEIERKRFQIAFDGICVHVRNANRKATNWFRGFYGPDILRRVRQGENCHDIFG